MKYIVLTILFILISYFVIFHLLDISSILCKNAKYMNNSNKSLNHKSCNENFDIIFKPIPNRLNREISPEYSHTVDLPINNPVSCKNICGPLNTCSITKEQCTSDIDCYGCQPVRTDPKNSTTKNLTNSTIKNLTNSNNDEPITLYLGENTWKNLFNKGIELYNKKQEYHDNLFMTDFEKSIQPHYPMHQSITGSFYETTPPGESFGYPPFNM